MPTYPSPSTTPARWPKPLRLLPALLLLAACGQSGTLAETREHPPFTLRITGGWTQALWGPRLETRQYAVYYQGQLLRFTAETGPDDAFDWCQPLPGGRLLLATSGDTLAPGHVQAGFHFYQLRVRDSGPQLEFLGPSCPANVLIPDQPAYWLTPDSLFLLLPTPDRLGLLENATYRLRDLRHPGAVLPVPPAPLKPDSAAREIRRIAYAPQRRQLTRIYGLASPNEELVEVLDLPAGRRRFYQRPDSAAKPAINSL